MRSRSKALLFINGERHEVGAEHAGMMLADFLRYRKQLTGTKIVCAEGDCGACTVLRFFPAPGLSTFLPINSCITPVAQLDGSSLVTVEALGKPEQLHPVQEAMRACHGSQCGFCTPGFVMALSGLVEKKLENSDHAPIAEKEARNALTGNLCRCTGYQPILDAAKAIRPENCESVRSRFLPIAQERELKAAVKIPLELQGEAFSFYAPTTLKAAASYLARNKGTRILASGTDLGVVHNKGKLRLTQLISLHLVRELYELKLSRQEVRVGARVSLTQLRNALEERVPEFARFLDLFASPQIKNIATLVGNVANASPIADTPPFLLIHNAVVEIVGPRGKREVPIADFYLGYRKTAVKAGELIAAIRFDLPAASDVCALYKVSERRDLDISCVNAGIRLQREKDGRVKRAFVAFGGVAATPIRLPRTEKLFCCGATASELEASLQAEISPISDVRGSAAFRRVLASNLLERFLREKLP